MIRCARLLFLMVFLLPAMDAIAAAPIPKPNPRAAAAAPDPQAAITRFVNGEDRMSPGVVAYAPASRTSLQPAGTKDASLYVVGKLADGGGPIGDGLMWRVFRDYPDDTGQLPLVYKGRGGDLEVKLKEGRYIVHAAYGRAAMSRVVDVRGPASSETFVLNAGGLQLNAVLEDDDETRKADAAFELYVLENGDRRMIGTVRPGAIARLPAGSYHVISKYGDLNAVRSADVVVEAGKLTRVSLRHQAGNVRLKLVRREGGEALADTRWTVYTNDGRAIYERVGAHANITLAAGRYAVVAKHRDDEFSQSFVVESGEDEEVIVMAQRYAPMR
ncbi:MAG: hypothetical protein AcusKO_48750 [Acuticoccus sp.]